MPHDPAPPSLPAARAGVGRGRPKSPTKGAAILRAALRLFSRHGVEAVTVEAIAAEAGVAKATIYSHFDDKLTLFEAMVHDHSARIASALVASDGSRAGPVREALRAFGVRLVGFLADPGIVAFHRLVSTEAARHPELGRRLYDAGPAVLHRALTAVLAAAERDGELAIDDPAAAAEILGGMLQGFWLTELRLNARAAPGPAEIEAWVERAVATFCRAYAPHLR